MKTFEARGEREIDGRVLGKGFYGARRGGTSKGQGRCIVRDLTITTLVIHWIYAKDAGVAAATSAVNSMRPVTRQDWGGVSLIKTLTKHGNSWALVIDKPVLELLNIEPETPLKIRTDGQTLIISPAGDSARKQKLRRALAETNRRYGKALKRLAE